MMEEHRRKQCDLFVDNYRLIKSSFKWDNGMNIRLGALLYAMEERVADTKAIKKCKSVIKEISSTFSAFKDTTYFMTASMLSLQQEPEEKFEKAVHIYQEMKKEGFHTSPYLTLAALSVALQVEEYDHRRVIATAKSFYMAMKAEHKFITSSDDYGFATLLAISDRPVEQTVKEMEVCYRLLKESFSYSNAVQSLTHVLALGEEDAALKCTRVEELYEALKKRKCKFGKGLELPFLGVVALLSEDTEKLCDEIVETNEYLKSKKGFGTWSIANQQRVMYAAALVCNDYVENAKNNTIKLPLANSITGIIIAQQLAMITASSAAASAAAVSASC